MAFHNTSERYEYIYGNNARKLAEEREIPEIREGSRVQTAPKRKNSLAQPAGKSVRRPHETDARTQEAIRRNQASFLAFDWKYTLVTLFAVVICVSAAMFYLHARVQLNVMENQISELKTEQTSLLSRQGALESEIDKSINLDEIRTYAEKNLHMVYPKDSRVILYQGESEDYFRQYESVNASE